MSGKRVARLQCPHAAENAAEFKREGDDALFCQLVIIHFSWLNTPFSFWSGLSTDLELNREHLL